MARSLHFGKGFECLVHVCVGVKPVQIQHIKRVQLHPAARRFAGLQQVRAARSPVIGSLGRDDQVIAAGTQKTAEQCFGCPVRIDMGGVEMGDPCINTGIEHGARCIGICAPAKLHGAKSKAAGGGAVGAGQGMFHPQTVPRHARLRNVDLSRSSHPFRWRADRPGGCGSSRQIRPVPDSARPRRRRAWRSQQES